MKKTIDKCQFEDVIEELELSDKEFKVVIIKINQ
jgi:hypothetical protein